MEPVEIDFIIGGNVQSEGKSITQNFDQMSESIAKTNSDIDRHKQAIIDLRKDLIELGTSYKLATTKQQKSEILEDIELTKKNLIDERESVKMLSEELKSLEVAGRSSSTVASNTQQMAVNAGRASVGYNSLNMSVQQVVRELPAASVGINTFFLGISNNIPILADHIKRATAENEALKASGQSTTPVWKQLIGSLFSWQSAMMVGITILSMYGKDIISWAEKLLTGKNAVDKTTESQKAMNKVFSDFTGEAARKIESVTKIGIEIQKYGDNSQNSKQIIDDFNKTFNTHLNTIEQVKNAYPGLSKAAIDAAIKIQAANSMIEKSAKYTLQKQESDTKLSPYSSKQIKEQEQMIDKLFEFAKKDGYDLNQLTTDLISGERTSLFGFMQTLGVNQLSIDDPLRKEFESLKKFFSNPDNLWFASLIAQQRKAGKELDLNNKEIMKVLNDVKFNDFSTKNTPDKKADKTYYDAALAIRKLKLDMDKQTSDLLVTQEDNSFQAKLDKISVEEEQEKEKIKLREDEIVKAYNNSHKNDKGFTEKKSLSEIDPEQAKSIEEVLTKLTAAYSGKRAKMTEDYYTAMVLKAKEMADKRVKIEYDYDEQIKKANEANNQELVKLLIAERDKKISEVTVSTLQETELFKVAVDDKLKLSAQMTDKLIADIETKLKAERAANRISEEDYRTTMDKLDKAKKGRKANDHQNNPFAQLSDAIGGNTDAQNNLKNFDPTGLTGEEATAQLAKLQSAASDATQAMAGAAGGALNGVNQILQSAVNGLDQLGLMSEEDKKGANQIMGMIGGAANLAMGIASGNPVQIIQGSIDLLSNAFEFFDFKTKRLEADQRKHLQNVKDLETAYKKLQRSVETALGTDIYSDQRAEIENNKKQIEDYNAWINDELAKPKRKQDKAKIAEIQDKIDELKNTNEDIAKSITESLAQTDAKSLANDLSDAITSAFQNGEDAAKAFDATADKVMQNAVKNALKLRYLEKPMQDAVNMLASDMEDGTLSNEEKEAFKQKIRDAGKLYQAGLEATNGLFTESLSVESGIKGDVAKMTEETGIALTGQITAMRLNVAALLAIGKNNLDNVGAILSTLEEIRVNTSFCQRLDRIDETLYYLKLNGIKVT